MSQLMSQLITPELMTAFTVFIVLLVVLYVLSIVWVIRDAYMRGTHWYVWGIVALVPLVGVIAYCLLRPPLLQIDRDEQELEVALKQRELMKYGECANCGYPVESDYVLCPNCHTRLKNLCPELPSCARACMDRVRTAPRRWVRTATVGRPRAAVLARSRVPLRRAKLSASRTIRCVPALRVRKSIVRKGNKADFAFSPKNCLFRASTSH